MDRRTLLKVGSLATLASVTPSIDIFSQSKIESTNLSNELSGFRKIKLGQLDFFILSDGFIRDKNLKDYAPRANLTELKQILTDNFRSDEYIDMAINILLVKTVDKLILFDSGFGTFSDENNGVVLESLAKTGFKPEQITDVLISHAHPDHIGGLLDKNGKVIYKNAQFHLSKIEFDFWMNATENDFKNSGLINNLAMVNGLIPKVREILTSIRPKINFIDFEKPLYENFSFIAAPGHTAGMTLTKITSNDEELIFVADLIHSDILLFPHPEWGYFGDTDLDIAIASRRKILDEVAKSKIKILAYHLPWPGLGHVKKTNNAFEWIPEAIFTP